MKSLIYLYLLILIFIIIFEHINENIYKSFTKIIYAYALTTLYINICSNF